MRGVPGYVEYDLLCYKYICWHHIRLFMLQFHPLAPKIPRALPSLNLPILFWFFVLGGVLGGFSDLTPFRTNSKVVFPKLKFHGCDSSFVPTIPFLQFQAVKHLI